MFLSQEEKENETINNYLKPTHNLKELKAKFTKKEMTFLNEVIHITQYYLSNIKGLKCNIKNKSNYT